MSSAADAIFPDGPPDSLYSVLFVESTATQSQIRSAYRKLALLHHPDKHATAVESKREEEALKFQQVGFAYAVLIDEKRRENYDRTGSLEGGVEGLDMGSSEGGWEGYFESLFEEVTREKLDDMKKAYQGSDEELNDLREAYISTSGSLPEILSRIPHSNYTDELRFIARLKPLIENGELPSFPLWDSTVSDEKLRKERIKAGKREEREAEEAAKELGVWDEFYGTGKRGARKGKGKKANAENEGENGDISALQAVILARRQKSTATTSSFLDGLAAKYAEPSKPLKGKAAKGKSKKRPSDENDENADDIEASPKKKSKRDAAEDLDKMDDEAFRQLQEGMFGKKSGEKANSINANGTGKATGKAKKSRK